MNQEKFIELIKSEVEQPAIDGVIKSLEKPAGRQPEKSLVEMSIWFNKLNGEEKQQIARIIQLSVTQSIFGFLAVIDGVASILESSEDDDPTLKLIYIDTKNEVLLNDPEEEFLHDIYRSI